MSTGGTPTSFSVHRATRLAALAATLVCVVAGWWVSAARAGVGDANTASCGNATTSGFQAYLPDCRSYELVSPPYKEGLQVEAAQSAYAEGESQGGAPLVIARSIGAFSGGPDTPSNWSDYNFLRTGAGWETDPVDPSPSQYIAGVVNANHAAVAVAG